MLYIIDTQGTTQAVITEPVYKGSVGVNNITLLAPFPANTQILVNAILPNGMALRNLYPMKAVVLPVELQNINKNNYTAFACTIDESLTLYPGTVQVQFQLINGFMTYMADGQIKLKPRVLATYTTGFAVGEGVNIESISINDIGDQDYMRAILGLLSEINSDPIKSIEYRNPNFLINSKLGNEASVDVVPSTYSDYHSDTGLTIDGMNNSNNRESFFNKFSDTESAGFKIDLGAVYNVGILQLFVWSKVTELTLEIKFEGGNETINRTVTVSSTTQSIPIITRLFANVEARYITIESSEYFDITGVQIFESNNYGEYVITQNSGAESILPIPTIAVDYFLSPSSTNPVQNRAVYEAITSAQNDALQAMNAAEFAIDKADAANDNIQGVSNRVTQVENVLPRTVFCNSFRAVVEKVFEGTLKSGDWLIDTTKDTVDFVVCAYADLGADFETIDYEAYESGNLLPPNAGDKFAFSDINNGKTYPIGIIAIEGGIVTPVVTGSEKYTRIKSSKLTEDMVVSWQLDKKLKKILITVTSPDTNIPEFALTGKTGGGYWESVIYLPAGTRNTALIEGEILVPGLVSRAEVYLGNGGGAPTEYYTNTNNFLKGDYYDGFRTTSACGAGTTITVYGVEI